MPPAVGLPPEPAWGHDAPQTPSVSPDVAETACRFFLCEIRRSGYGGRSGLVGCGEEVAVGLFLLKGNGWEQGFGKQKVLGRGSGEGQGGLFPSPDGSVFFPYFPYFFQKSPHISSSENVHGSTGSLTHVTLMK